MSLKCQNSQAEVGLQCGEQWEEVGKTGWGVFEPGREPSLEPEPIGINSRVAKVFQRGGRGRQTASGVEVLGEPSRQRRVHGS